MKTARDTLKSLRKFKGLVNAKAYMSYGPSLRDPLILILSAYTPTTHIIILSNAFENLFVS